MSTQSEAKKVAQYIAWFVGAFLGAGGGTVLLSPNPTGNDHEHVAFLESRLTNLERELRTFRDAGERFTAADGQRHDKRISKVETQVDRCRETSLGLKQRLWIMEMRNGGSE